MKKMIYNSLLPFYSFVNRKMNPIESYPLVDSRVAPLSRKFGIDRGTPIDRYYIEKFLQQHKKHIKGKVLEVGDARYIKKYGRGRVASFDILDVEKNNKEATIIADLRNVVGVKDELYDCIILTQVLGMIDDTERVVSECYRMLKKGGVLLVTSSSISPAIDTELSYWRFTSASMKYLLKKKFKLSNVSIQSFGNVYVGQAFWVGAAMEDIPKKILSENDSQYPILVAAYAKK